MFGNKKFLTTVMVVLLAIVLLIAGPAVAYYIDGAVIEEPEINLAPLNPAFVEYMENWKREEVELVTEEGYSLGYIPPPLDLPHPRVTLDSEHIIQMTDLPDSFDLRDLNRVTTVKNQGPAGSCWAFATYGSLESYLKQWETYDFSENHLKNTHGFDLDHDQGGNQSMATAYLARWSGPVSEQDDPYDPHSGVSPPGLDPIMHVQKVERIPWMDQDYNFYGDEIKQTIKDHGALFTGFHWDSDYYCEDNYAYYFYGEVGALPNHAVAIVGWDDNYAKENFDDQPPGDGALILKNSWGDEWGDAGYFYMSYHDYYAGFVATAFHNAEPADNYSRVYQYDPLGLVTAINSGTHIAYGANIFTAASNGNLAAVSTYAVVPNTGYEINIYTGVSANRPVRGELRHEQSGTLPRNGYHTIPLNDIVPLVNNQLFSVVIKFTTTPDNNFVQVPIEMAYDNYSSGASANPGESFFSTDGNTWHDVSADTPAMNICIKAFSTEEASGCTITTPNQPTGPLAGFVNETYTYSTSGSNCDCGSAVEYRFIWLDPNHQSHFSDWATMTSANISFSLTGKYIMTAQAQCEKSQTESGYAPIIEIKIEEEEPFIDIVIESLTVEPSLSALSTELTATIVLKNNGTIASSGFYLDLYINRDTAPDPDAVGDRWKGNAGLAPDETRTETFTFTPSATGSYQAWAQAQTVQTISGDHPVYGPVPYVVEAINEHSIYNITFDPPHPATLEFGDRVYFDFDYTSTNSEEVQIRGIPMTGGSNTQNFHSIYINLPTGTGSGSGSFRILDAGQTEAQDIDQVRFIMHCRDTFDLLCEIFVDVDYTYRPAEDPAEDIDLVVQSLTVEPSSSELGTQLTATVVIKNEGSVDATDSFWTEFYLHEDTAPNPGDWGDYFRSSAGLKAGATETLAFQFTPTLAGSFQAWAQVDSGFIYSDTPHVYGPVNYVVDAPVVPDTYEISTYVAHVDDWETPRPDLATVTTAPVDEAGEGETVEVYIDITEGYTVAAGGVIYADNTVEPLTEVIADHEYEFVMPAQSVHVIFSIKEIPAVEYDLTISVEGQGSTVPAEGTHTYEEVEDVTVKATPAEGWQFVQWTGDASGTNPEITVTMDANKSITAHFSSEQTFTDVPFDHPFFDEIEKLVALEITTGWPDGTFRPTLPVTRQAAAAFLFRALELEDPGVTDPTFFDVLEDHPFFDEIEALAATEITTGWPDGTFRPTLPVTRQAAAAFLFRALELEDPGVTEPTFSDVPLDHPFFVEIEALAATGITTGWPDSTFRPTLAVTRQAMAAFLVRALELE